MIVLDASPLIALLDRDDPHHGPVSALLDTHATESWAVGALTLAEVMVRAAEDPEVLAALAEDLADLGLDVLPLADTDVESLAVLRAESGLRMPDCCVLLAARQVGGRLLTTDRRLADRAAHLGVQVLVAR